MVSASNPLHGGPAFNLSTSRCICFVVLCLLPDIVLTALLPCYDHFGLIFPFVRRELFRACTGRESHEDDEVLNLSEEDASNLPEDAH